MHFYFLTCVCFLKRFYDLWVIALVKSAPWLFDVEQVDSYTWMTLLVGHDIWDGISEV